MSIPNDSSPNRSSFETIKNVSDRFNIKQESGETKSEWAGKIIKKLFIYHDKLNTLEKNKETTLKELSTTKNKFMNLLGLSNVLTIAKQDLEAIQQAKMNLLFTLSSCTAAALNLDTLNTKEVKLDIVVPDRSTGTIREVTFKTHIPTYPLPALKEEWSHSLPTSKAPEILPVPNREAVEVDCKQAFAILTQETRRLDIPLVTKSECDHRFDDVMCPAETIVKVEIAKGEGPQKLHANRVQMSDGKSYIATQSPPTPKAQELYWKMAMEHSSQIVDLTNKNDQLQTRSYPNLASTYPQNLGDTTIFGSMTVTCIEQKQEGSFNFSKYRVTDGQGTTKNIERLNYQEWQDFSGTSAEDLKRLIAHADKMQGQRAEPLVVHCRAGVGRTGTFITARTLSHQSNRLNADNFMESTNKIILSGRQQRGPLFVQSEKQLMTLVAFGNELMQSKVSQETPKVQIKEETPKVQAEKTPATEAEALFDRLGKQKCTSRYDAPIKLQADSTLPFVVWESASQRGSYGVWIRGEKDPALFDQARLVKELSPGGLLANLKIKEETPKMQAEKIPATEAEALFDRLGKQKCTSRYDAPTKLQADATLPFVVWESASQRGSYGVWIRGEKDPALFDQARLVKELSPGGLLANLKIQSTPKKDDTAPAA